MQRIRSDAAAVVHDRELQLPGWVSQGNLDPRGEGVPGNVGQDFLENTKHLCGALRRQIHRRRQADDFAGDAGAFGELPRLELQCRGEAEIVEQAGAEVARDLLDALKHRIGQFGGRGEFVRQLVTEVEIGHPCEAAFAP